MTGAAAAYQVRAADRVPRGGLSAPLRPARHGLQPVPPLEPPRPVGGIVALLPRHRACWPTACQQDRGRDPLCPLAQSACRAWRNSLYRPHHDRTRLRSPQGLAADRDAIRQTGHQLRLFGRNCCRCPLLDLIEHRARQTPPATRLARSPVRSFAHCGHDRIWNLGQAAHAAAAAFLQAGGPGGQLCHDRSALGRGQARP